MSAPGVSTPTTRILVVEDDPEIQYLLSQVLLEDDREVIVAGTAAEGERRLAEEVFHLLVLDLLLPDADGRSLLRSLRARRDTAHLPVLVLTSRTSQALRFECFELGADAFVEKPFDPDALASDVSLRLERSALRARRETQDELTGLLNLAGLIQALGALAGRGRTLVVAELDGLRAVSDRHGWAAAEGIVEAMGRALASAFPGVPLARPAGGEFALVLPRGEGVEDPGPRLLDVVRRTPLSGPDGETFRVTASAAVLADQGSTEGPAMVDAARVLVQRAKDQGGNRVASPPSPGAEPPMAPLVLVAEDDDITAKILVHRLTKEGFEVVRFDNGSDAYRGALARTPSLVVLDVKMPGMDGFELLERLRKTPAYARVPVMMLTAMGGEADVVRGFELGADDYLLKPFSPTELLARIRRLVRRGHSAA